MDACLGEVKANPERMRAGLEEMDSMVDVLE
jgi:hypothetical protein